MTQHAPQASAAHLNRVLLDTNDLTCPSERAWKLLEIHAAMDRAPTPAPIRHFWTRSWNATLRELRPPLRAAFRSLHAPPARTLRPPPTALILAALAAVVRPPALRAALLLAAAWTARRARHHAARHWRAQYARVTPARTAPR